MLYVKKVAEFLNIDTSSARKVVEYMSFCGFDFSESDWDQIEHEANHVWKMMTNSSYYKN